MIHNRIIIIGHGASGKDHLKKLMINRGFIPSISFTSRPPRENEFDGVHYKFVSKDRFLQMIIEDKFYEWNKFKEDWYYGTTKDDFYSSNIFIMTPSGVNALSPQDRKSSFIIYLNIPEDIRRSRLESRSDADSVERRLSADNKDFENFTDYDVMFTNDNF